MVSFIIPVYKTPLQLLRNCLDSVLKYSQPMELICVLDSPGDSCERVLDEYAAKESRMRLLKNDRNRGVSYARNRGLDDAKGEYVAFVDADDEIVADGYEQVAELLEQNDFAGCVLSATKNPESRWGIEYGGMISGTIYDHSVAVKLIAAYYMAVYPMILRRRLFLAYNIQFLEGQRFGEDFIVMTKLLWTGERFAFLNKIGYKCVGHPESTCRAKVTSDRYTHGLIAGLLVFREILSKRVDEDVRRWYILRILPMILFDQNSSRYVKGAERVAYLINLKELVVLLLAECRQQFGCCARFVLCIVGHYPNLWFLPGMPLSQALRLLCHFKWMLSR